jgi:hypothetical protein
MAFSFLKNHKEPLAGWHRQPEVEAHPSFPDFLTKQAKYVKIQSTGEFGSAG